MAFDKRASALTGACVAVAMGRLVSARVTIRDFRACRAVAVCRADWASVRSAGVGGVGWRGVVE